MCDFTESEIIILIIALIYKLQTLKKIKITAMKKLVVVLFLTIMVGIAFGSGIDDNETSGEAGAEGENSISGDSTSGDATSEDETSGDSSNDISGIGRGHYIPRSELTRSVLGIGWYSFKFYSGVT